MAKKKPAPPPVSKDKDKGNNCGQEEEANRCQKVIETKPNVSCRFACPDAGRAPSPIANTSHLARCAYFRALLLGRGQRASTVVFSPPRGVNSPRITHHSG